MRLRARIDADDGNADVSPHRAQRQHQFGKHTYALSDFGLDRPALEGRFTKYLNRFDSLAEAS
jgi:hypothetical protein